MSQRAWIAEVLGMNVKVKDLTSEELKSLIQETVEEAMLELLGDPDRGLRLTEDVRKRLQRSLEHLQQGEQVIPAEEVVKRAGLAQ